MKTNIVERRDKSGVWREENGEMIEQRRERREESGEWSMEISEMIEERGDRSFKKAIQNNLLGWSLRRP